MYYNNSHAEHNFTLTATVLQSVCLSSVYCSIVLWLLLLLFHLLWFFFRIVLLLLLSVSLPLSLYLTLSIIFIIFIQCDTICKREAQSYAHMHTTYIRIYTHIIVENLYKYVLMNICTSVCIQCTQQTKCIENNIVTFLPFKNVDYMSSLIANKSKNKYMF